MIAEAFIRYVKSRSHLPRETPAICVTFNSIKANKAQKLPQQPDDNQINVHYFCEPSLEPFLGVPLEMGVEDPQEDRQHKVAAFTEYYEHSEGKENNNYSAISRLQSANFD